MAKGLSEIRIGDVVEYDGSEFMLDFGLDGETTYLCLKDTKPTNPNDIDIMGAYYTIQHAKSPSFELKVKINWVNQENTYLEIKNAYNAEDFKPLDMSKFIVTSKKKEDSPRLFIYGLNDWGDFKSEYGENQNLRQEEANKALTKIAQYLIKLVSAVSTKINTDENFKDTDLNCEHILTELLDSEGVHTAVQTYLFLSDIFVDIDEISTYLYRRVLSITNINGETLGDTLRKILSKK